MITSVQNPQVKEWKKLHKKKYREKHQQFLIEGHHLIEEAYKSNWAIETIIVRDGEDIPSWGPSGQTEIVDDRVFNEIAQTETPQGIAAVVHMNKNKWKDGVHILLIDAVQDPGNLGTIIRTADAAGFANIIIGNGTVDLYNDKVIRASQGSIFHIDVIQDDLHHTIPLLKEQHYTVWAAALQNALPLKEAVFQGKIAIMLGNEGNGIEDSLLQQADCAVKIPIYGEAESLNVSVAAGILMYHVRN